MDRIEPRRRTLTRDEAQKKLPGLTVESVVFSDEGDADYIIVRFDGGTSISMYASYPTIYDDREDDDRG